MTAGVRLDAQIAPQYTELYASDSMRLLGPSLSPNGRWVAFAGGTQAGDETLIYVVPSAGGTPISVTHGAGNDGQPLWVPSGDAIVFHSSRVNGGLMKVSIDPATGRATGEPTRMTLESRPVQAFAVSPDGKQLAIGLRPVAGHAEIKILPLEGGATRTVTGVDGTIVQLFWPTTDSLEYLVGSPAKPEEFVITRVSAAGGQPQIGTRYDLTKGFTVLGSQFAYRGARVRINADTLGAVSVISRAGDRVATFDTKGSWMYGTPVANRIRPTSNPEVVLLASARPRTTIRYGKLGGDGSSTEFRKVSRDPYTESTAGFTPDSKSMYVTRYRDGKTDLEVAPLDGKTPRAIRIGDGPREVYPTTTGRYAYVVSGHGRDSSRALQLLDLRSGSLQKISDHLRSGLLKQSRGSEDVFFAETNANHIDIRHYAPGSTSTLIASLDTAGLRLPRFEFEEFSSRGIAYARVAGDSARLYTQRGASAHLVAAVRGTFENIALSPDGREMFFAATRRDSQSGQSVGQLVELDDDLQPRGAPRTVVTDVIGIDGSAWSPDAKTVVVGTLTRSRSDTVTTIEFVSRSSGSISRAVDLPHSAATRETPFVWSKDNSHVFVLMANEPSETRMDIWRIGMAANERPVSFVSREANMIWDYVLSPDEKLVAYTAELQAHQALWKVTLPGLARAKR